MDIVEDVDDVDDVNNRDDDKYCNQCNGCYYKSSLGDGEGEVRVVNLAEHANFWEEPGAAKVVLNVICPGYVSPFATNPFTSNFRIIIVHDRTKNVWRSDFEASRKEMC